jgi:hypothetical protein
MSNRVHGINADQALGLLGLFLMPVVARLAEPGYSLHHTVAGGLDGFVAR